MSLLSPSSFHVSLSLIVYSCHLSSLQEIVATFAWQEKVYSGREILTYALNSFDAQKDVRSFPYILYQLIT